MKKTNKIKALEKSMADNDKGTKEGTPSDMKRYWKQMPKRKGKK